MAGRELTEYPKQHGEGERRHEKDPQVGKRHDDEGASGGLLTERCVWLGRARRIVGLCRCIHRRCIHRKACKSAVKKLDRKGAILSAVLQLRSNHAKHSQARGTAAETVLSRQLQFHIGRQGTTLFKKQTAPRRTFAISPSFRCTIGFRAQLACGRRSFNVIRNSLPVSLNKTSSMKVRISSRPRPDSSLIRSSADWGQTLSTSNPDPPSPTTN